MRIFFGRSRKGKTMIVDLLFYGIGIAVFFLAAYLFKRED
jgi:hypothetical protein